MLAARRVEVDRLNTACQEVLAGRGRLGAERLQVEDRHLAVGDRVVCGKNSIQQLGVANGSRGTITALDSHDRTLTLRLDGTNGRTVVLPRSYLEGRGRGMAARRGRGATYRPPARPIGAAGVGDPARPGPPRQPGEPRPLDDRPRWGVRGRLQAVPGPAPTRRVRAAMARPLPARPGSAGGVVGGRPGRPGRPGSLGQGRHGGCAGGGGPAAAKHAACSPSGARTRAGRRLDNQPGSASTPPPDPGGLPGGSHLAPSPASYLLASFLPRQGVSGPMASRAIALGCVAPVRQGPLPGARPGGRNAGRPGAS